MEFEFDMKTIGVALVFWLFVLLLIWKWQIEGMEWALRDKIIITVVSLPLFYFAANYQLNR